MTNILDISLDSIKPSPFQCRKYFNEEALQELAKSISRDGLIEPVVVRQNCDGYELIAGERRCRASRLAGLPTILGRVIEADDLQARRMAAAENLQRQDLSEIEAIEGIVELVDSELCSDEEYANLATSPLARVKFLLGKLDAVRVSRDRGSTLEPENEALFHKFVEQVESVFTGLPKPKEWRSFYVHDLPLITKLDEDVKAVATKNKLNKAQTMALQELKKKAPEQFNKAKRAGIVVVSGLANRKDGEAVEVNDLSAAEIKTLAQTEFPQRIFQDLAPIFFSQPSKGFLPISRSIYGDQNEKLFQQSGVLPSLLGRPLICSPLPTPRTAPRSLFHRRGQIFS